MDTDDAKKICDYHQGYCNMGFKSCPLFEDGDCYVNKYPPSEWDLEKLERIKNSFKGDL